MSLNHKIIDTVIDKKDNIKMYFDSLNEWKLDTPDVVKANNDILQFNGQGDGETK